MFGHRNGFGEFRTHTGVPGGYRNPPGRLMGLLGPSGEEEGRPRAATCRLPPPVRIGQGGGRRPPFLSPSLCFHLLSYSQMEGGSPTPGGSRTPHGARLGWPAPSPSPVRIGQRGGAPPFLSPSLSFPLLSYSHLEGGVLLPMGVGLLMERA